LPVLIDILPFPARVVVTAADAPHLSEEVSGMIMSMPITARPQHRYDHRLRISSNAPGT
jgi:hypothetical protein